MFDRLREFSLSLHPEKTRLIEFGRFAVERRTHRRLVSLSSGDEVPHIFTRKSRLQPGEFLITSAKDLLQQYLPIATKCTAANCIVIRSPSGHADRWKIGSPTCRRV